MRQFLALVALLWLAAIHVGIAVAVCTLTGCQHRPRHVDYIPAEPPRREYYLPHYYPQPRPKPEREA
jgi:hypothetical protein